MLSCTSGWKQRSPKVISQYSLNPGKAHWYASIAQFHVQGLPYWRQLLTELVAHRATIDQTPADNAATGDACRPGNGLVRLAVALHLPNAVDYLGECLMGPKGREQKTLEAATQRFEVQTCVALIRGLDDTKYMCIVRTRCYGVTNDLNGLWLSDSKRLGERVSLSWMAKAPSLHPHTHRRPISVCRRANRGQVTSYLRLSCSHGRG